MPSIFTDQSPTATGTALNQSVLNTAVVAQSYLISGGIPGSFSGSSLSVTQPATAAVINQGTSASYINAPSTTLTMTPSTTQYVDMDSAGSYFITTTGTPAAGRIRLYQCITSASGVTSLTQQATPDPVSQTGVQYDSAEAGTNDTLSATSGLLNNLNRMRYQMGLLVGGSWNALVQMIPLSQKAAASGVASLDANSHVLQQAVDDATEASTMDTLGSASTIVNNLNRIRNQLGVVIGGAGASWNAAVQMIPLSQKAANSGVASLNASGFLAQLVSKGVRQVVIYQPGADITIDSSHQTVPSTTYANWGHLADVAITTVSGSSIVALSVGTAWNYYTGGGNWWRAALGLDGGSVQYTAGQVNATVASAAFNTPSVVLGVWTGVSVGAHNVNIIGAAGGPGATNPSGGYKPPTGATDSGLTVIVIEFV